ncbi:M16 family metallopeptidase [Patescibacteria group bacterium]
MYSEYKVKKFDSGLRLVSVPMEGVNSMTVLAMVGVGSRYENSKRAGMAHFLEHMVFKGTANYPTAMDISSNIDGVGGQYNAFTGKDYTGYYAKVASEHLDLALDVISDMLLTARLRGEDIEREKGVIVEEMNMYEDDPRRKVDDIYDEVIYGESDLGRHIIGSKGTVRSFKSADFFDFLDSWYDLSNVVLVVAGDDEKMGEDLEKKVGGYFGKGKKRSGKGKVDFSVPKQTKAQLKVSYKETEQAHFYLGFPGFKRGHEDKYAQSVLMTMLGGNSSARLFNEIREKRGLAYYAYASVATYADIGSVYAFEGVDPKRVDEAISLTLREFKRMSDGDYERMEVERAKDYVRGKLTLDWEDSQNVALTYARKMVLVGEVESPDQIFAGVEKVKTEDVVKVAKKLFVEDKLNLALIGPYKDKSRFEKLLKL